MKKTILTLLFLMCLTSSAHALVASVTEEDGSPDTYPWQIKFPNGSLTDNGDNTTSYSAPAGSSEWTDNGAYLTPNEDESVSISQDLTVEGDATVSGDVYAGAYRSSITNQKSIYRNSSNLGHQFEDGIVDIQGDLSVGVALTTVGAVYPRGTISKGFIDLPVQSTKLLHLSTPATISGANNRWRLLFDDGVTASAEWSFRMPDDYNANAVIKIGYSMESATTNKVDFEAQVMAVSDGDAADVDTDSFAAVNEVTGGTTVPGTAGHLDEITLTLSNNDSLAAGDYVVIKVNRDHDDADDTASGNAEVRYVQAIYDK